jgi:hypothetical protein
MSGFPSSYPYTLILEKDSANEEIVTITALVGTSLTITRGVDGTSGRSHSAGISVEHGVIALDFTNFRAHEAAAANVHDIGAGASVVGTTTAQTLSSKTLGSALAAGGFKITGLADPTNAQDAATKNWAETGMTSQLTQATTQATNAASSASAASSSASAASSSASAASSSQSAAATSASNASTSATNAAASASSASGSASTATTQAGNASTSATAAAGSASSASTSAGTAATQASNASTSATNSASSASAAASSASAASTSETNAATSATNAAASYDSFDDRYLGSKSSAPTLDNDGNALLTGALYFDSTAGQMYVWNGSAWVTTAGSSTPTVIDVNSSSAALRITQTGTGHALLVEDSANPDSTPFMISASGNVGIGASNAAYNLTIASDTSTALGMTRSSTDATGAFQYFIKQRGTAASPTVVASGDVIGNTQYWAHDGTSIRVAASISAAVDGTPGTSDMPGRLTFSTTADGSATLVERMRIDNAGVVTIAGTPPAVGTSTTQVATTEFVTSAVAAGGGGGAGYQDIFLLMGA